MPATNPGQSQFNAGELSPLLSGRVDVAYYGQGASLMRNFLPLIQGPPRRREGTRFVGEVKNSAKVWLARFVFDFENAYILEFGDLYIRFFKDRAPITLTPVAITGATQANPVVITATAHGFANGDRVLITGAGGMVELNNREFAVANVAANTFELSGIDGTGFSAYTSGGQAAEIYEIVSPWSAADLTDSSGAFALSMVQSGDVIYITHPVHKPRKLNRFGHTNWTITDYVPIGGPFNDVNLDETITVYASAATGAGITLTASSAIFTNARIGSLFYIQPKDLSVVSPWEPHREIAASGVRRRNDGKTYISASGAADQVTGTVAPTHERGTQRDGTGTLLDPRDGTGIVNVGIDWTFEDLGFGIAEITAVGGTTATATVRLQAVGGEARLPFAVVGVSNATWRWAWGAWSEAEGFPSTVTFFRERLVFAKDQRLFFSAPGGFDDMGAQRSVGEVNADNAIVIAISSDRNDEIKWLSPQGALLVGTSGGELACSEMTTQQVFGPNNVKVTPQTSHGSFGLHPLRVGDATLYLERSRRKLREIVYSYETDAWVSPDLTVRSEHITKPGIVDAAYAQTPDSMIWAAREDGPLVGFTYNKEQDVLAWHAHPIGGFSDAAQFAGAVVESVEVIPSPDGTRDDLWMVVRRRINGATKRYVEVMTEPVLTPEQTEGETDAAYAARLRYHQALHFFVDSGLTLDAPISISAATQANPVSVTATAHGLTTGDKVRIDQAVGMWQINGLIHTVTVVDPNTFTLDGVNGTAFGAYVGGGQARKLVSTVSGLFHLEGQTVQVLADGAAHPDRVVTNGAIVLQQPAAIVHVGLGYRSVLRSMRIEAGGARGTAQNKTKRITKMGVRLHETLGGKMGPSPSKLDPILYRTSEDLMGFPPPLFTGDRTIQWPAGYETDAFVTFVQDQPLPATIVAFWPELVTYER